MKETNVMEREMSMEMGMDEWMKKVNEETDEIIATYTDFSGVTDPEYYTEEELYWSELGMHIEE